MRVCVCVHLCVCMCVCVYVCHYPSCMFVPQGYVYVPETNNDMIVSLVCNKFRARVSEELVVSGALSLCVRVCVCMYVLYVVMYVVMHVCLYTPAENPPPPSRCR